MVRVVLAHSQTAPVMHVNHALQKQNEGLWMQLAQHALRVKLLMLLLIMDLITRKLVELHACLVVLVVNGALTFLSVNCVQLGHIETIILLAFKMQVKHFVSIVPPLRARIQCELKARILQV